ncbi:hypothetical protein BpHYR1_043515 [Brachionus plicatilis]|uniref:Uncharacterized protein n=1 Tax=Brachionus plicatilis TaxID=10195 RepID=A0A3M7RJR1_BRAPC|nr:hypothetical protein BpHYR1_043515 [Brachionus plicatilis]
MAYVDSGNLNFLFFTIFTNFSNQWKKPTVLCDKKINTEYATLIKKASVTFYLDDFFIKLVTKKFQSENIMIQNKLIN